MFRECMVNKATQKRFSWVNKDVNRVSCVTTYPELEEGGIRKL